VISEYGNGLGVMLGKFNADFAAGSAFFITCDTNVAGDDVG